jgi:tight adherence protein B
MNVGGMLHLLLATISVAVAVWLAWFWWLPVLQRISQKPIAEQLDRLGEIGFDDPFLRTKVFLLETMLAVSLLISSVSYLGVFLGGVLMAVMFHARAMILTWIIDKRERLLRQQTLSLAVGLHGLAQSGQNISDSIQEMATETPAPLGKQIARVASNYRLGRPLNESIAEARSILRMDAFSLLVTSITCAIKEGTELTDALVGVQESLEHRDQVERQLSAKTSTARTTILILSCTPFGFFTLFYLVMPDSMQLIFLTSSGKILLAIIIGILYTGVAWARSLMRFK